MVPGDQHTHLNFAPKGQSRGVDPVGLLYGFSSTVPIKRQAVGVPIDSKSNDISYLFSTTCAAPRVSPIYIPNFIDKSPPHDGNHLPTLESGWQSGSRR